MAYNGKKIILIRLFLVAISLLLSVFPAEAANKYWARGTDPDTWNDPNNWSNTSGGMGGAGVSGTNDTAVFDGGNTNSCQIDIFSTVASVIIYSMYTATVSINSRKSLTTSDSFEIGGGIFTTNGELLEVDSYSQTGGIFNTGGWTITCNGNFSVAVGTFNAAPSTLILGTTYGDVPVQMQRRLLGIRKNVASDFTSGYAVACKANLKIPTGLYLCSWRPGNSLKFSLLPGF